jgi:hypothetical protein
MTTALPIPPDPVGQQAPPTRAAASDPGRSLRVARGPLLLTHRDGLAPCLTNPQETDITIIIQRRRHAPASNWSRCAGTNGRNRRNCAR